MPNYNDFDLDIRRAPYADGTSPAAFSATPKTCITVVSVIVDISLQLCATVNDCHMTEGDCTTGCTDESCSDCHSYCGAACRR